MYWLKYFDIPTRTFWYVMYMLCIYYIYWQFFCQGHDSTPGFNIMLLKQQHLSVSGQAADLARQHPPVEYVWPLQLFWRGHSAQPGFLQPLWGTSLEDSWNHFWTEKPTEGRFWVLLCLWCGPYHAEGQPCLRDQHRDNAVELWTAPASRGQPLSGQDWEDQKEVPVWCFQARMGN